MSDQAQQQELGITSWYLNTQRVLESIGIGNLPFGFIDSLKGIEGHLLQKGLLVSMLSPVLIDWVKREKIPALEELLLNGKLQAGSLFTYDGKFFSSGLAAEKPSDATLKLPLKDFDDPRTLLLQFHADNLTTSTARSALMGQPSVFTIAYVSSIDGTEVIGHPLVIGNLVQIYGKHKMELRYRDFLEMRPEGFDALRDVDFTQRLTKSDLDVLKDFPEAKIKEIFADIFGEPEVPKDWGGEECDLFSSNVLVDGKRSVAAFAFKGPAKFKPLECRDCGKNGDQIVRLCGSGADIFVLQHCHSVTPAVRKTIAALTRGNLAAPRRFCIIDGYETIKILRRFGHLSATK